MTNTLDFGIWSIDEATFWQSWVTAGIALEPYKLAPGYTGMSISTQSKQGWTPVKNGVPVSGWHANVRVYDPALIAMFTHGLEQRDVNGQFLPLFQRTWAAEVFQLVEQPADAITGFPAGYRNSQGVTYADLTPGVTPLKSPTNTWA